MNEFGVEEPVKKGKRNIFIISVISILVVLVIALITIYYAFFFAKKRFGSKIIELGEEISSDVSDYISGSDWILEKAELDFGDLDLSNPGTYTVKCNAWIYSYEYKITVQDTVAPTIKRKSNDTFHLETNKEYSIEDFIEEVYDLSGNVETYFDNASKTISFDERGEKAFYLCAKDESGNESKEEYNVSVHNPPTIIGARDIECLVREGVKNDLVMAFDEDLNKINVKYSESSFSEAGVHEVEIKATDQYGISTVEKINVTVKKDSKKKPSTVYTAAEIELLNKANYFKSYALKEADRDKAIKEVENAMLHIDASEKTSGGGFFGSGSVYKITNDYVYFLSVGHIVNKFEDKNIKLYNNKGDYFEASGEDFEIQVVGEYNEFGMFRIPLSKVNAYWLVNVKESIVDTSAYNELHDGDPIVAVIREYTINRAEKGRDFDTDLTVIQSKVQFNHGQGFNFNNCILTENEFVGGMSGGSLIDYKGRTVGLISGYARMYEFDNEWRGFSMRLDDIKELESRFK